MTATRTQADMYYNAVRNSCERDETFMELIRGGLTRQELAVNIERRPSLWSRYAGYFRTLPSSPMRDPASLLLGENDQHREIINRMIDVIKDTGLEILQRHPTDVVVYDRQRLVQVAYAGAKLLWLVNDSASHLFLLDVHPDENRVAKSRLTCGTDYVCCCIEIGDTVEFSVSTIEKAAIMCDTATEYTANYISSGIVEIAHHGQKIATMKISTRPGQTPVTIIPEDAITQMERGATNHHHRWQIAYKTKGETAETVVRSITWQVGRTGRVTPVLEIDPVELSGATIRRVTAHTAAIVQAKGIGTGAVIQIIRSGEVIPKVEAVIQPAETVEVPTQCPCCNTVLETDGEYLFCPGGIECMSQALGILEHFCQTLEIDGSGPGIIAHLVHGTVETFSQIFTMTTDDLENMGVSSGVARNFAEAIQERKRQPIDDWRVLAAFGIRHLGRGDAKKLLAKTRIGGLNFVTAEFLAAIDGFGPITSPLIAADIQRLLPEINAVVNHLTIRHTMDAVQPSSLPLKGKRVVFTGTFASADRKVLEMQAEALGAQVQSGVNAKTDFLILGDKPGSKKVAAAQALSVTVLDEARYVDLISQ